MTSPQIPGNGASVSSGGMRHIDPKDISVRENFALLQGGIAPRPIALVSTVAPDGSRNLSPFSFFNAFGGNPPTVCFSPSRRQRDGTVKDTYSNLIATKECVIQAVTYAMVQQVSLASTEYPTGTDEFIKSGLTPIPSDIVKPPRVAESPFQMECRLQQMIHLGDGHGSGNLAICEIVRFHVADDLFIDGVLHPDAIDLVGRNSADFYTRASGDAIFYVKKPLTTRGVGVDQLPEFIRNSDILTGNNLGQLGNTEHMPTLDEVLRFIDALTPIDISEIAFHRLQQRNDFTAMLRAALFLAKSHHPKAARWMEHSAKVALDTANETTFAWMALLYAEVARRELSETHK